MTFALDDSVNGYATVHSSRRNLPLDAKRVLSHFFRTDYSMRSISIVRLVHLAPDATRSNGTDDSLYIDHIISAAILWCL